MTKKEFKRAMQCGLGRCIQELKTCGNIEKYRDSILWGCTHNLAYDAQCEGTRSYYLYKLVKCYPDADFFVDAVIPYFYKSIAKSDWSFEQFCDFLGLFAGEGNQTALHALQENYRRMYALLKTRKRKLSDGTLTVRDNFETLCIAIVNIADYKEDCEDAYFRMVEDLGCLMLDNPLFDYWDFDWFQAFWEDEFGKAKIRKQLEQRAENAKLQKNAFRALTLGSMTDIRVHNYALELLQKNEYLEDVISMLANNYVKEDYDILAALIKELPVTYQEKDICWHGPFTAILNLLETRGVKHPPKELLYYMYEHTLCSCCKESILREMSRRKMLTREILQECLYDSNDEIREFAKKRLAKLE